MVLRALTVYCAAVAGILLASLGATRPGFGAQAHASPPFSHYADAGNATLAEEGGQIYAYACSSCHGRRLQGQALWQLKDRFAGRRAPAHDATGHTWQHSDEELFRMTKFGRFAAMPANLVSYMPAFAGKLSDREILATIAFIKSNWPMGLRASQAMLNPGFAGMPANAGKLNWTLPPNCTESIRTWSEGSK
ncbi:MAG TPA: cytochrome c [Rhizomicrobium sp.]